MSVRHVRPAHPAGLRNPGRTKQIGTDRRQHIRTDGAAGTRQIWPAETAFQCFVKKPSSLFYVSLHGFIFLTAPTEHSLHAWTDLRPVLPDLVSVLPDLQIRRQPRPRHLSRPCQTPERLLFRYPITSPDSEGNFHFGSAIHLRGQNAVQMHRRPVGVEGGRKKCPPSTRIGTLHARMPFGQRRWIAELPVPADMEIRMICANRRPQRADNKNLEAICSAKPALRRPVWPIIRNILHPGRHKNSDQGAAFFQSRFSINILNSHNAPKSLRKRRLGSIRFQKTAS